MSAEEVQAAVAELQAGRRADALKRLRGLGAAAVDDPLALQAWAVSLGPESRAQSLALLERAVRIAPADAQAHFNLAVNLQAVDDLPRAIAHYAQSLRLAPGNTGALNNLSDLLRRRGRPEEGWALMQRYLAAGASPSGLEIRLAKLALDTHRLDEAERWFLAAVAAAPPSDPKVAFEHAMLLLAREDYARGWPAYEARLQTYGLPALAIYPYGTPAWDGLAKPGQQVLLHREQGLGDMIMFASAVDGVIEDGATPHLAMAPSLNRIFAESFPRAKVWSSVTVIGAARQPPQRFLQVCGPLQAQAPMASMGALRLPQGPLERRPYLKAPPAEVGRWKARMESLAPPRPGERRIGLVIGARLPRFSDDGLTNGLRKSIPAAEIEALADVANARWFSLHDRDSAAQLADGPRLPIVDLSPWITDFADTAAAIANLDLVISVDTAVAHLVGAMGKPLWLLLWRNADWRWGVDREDSAWYSQVRTFRQGRAGRWGEVVERVVTALG